VQRSVEIQIATLRYALTSLCTNAHSTTTPCAMYAYPAIPFFVRLNLRSIM